MIKHWEHTEIVDSLTFKTYSEHRSSISISGSNQLHPNTAVYVQCNITGKRLEGVYDASAKSIRRLRGDQSAPNRDLKLYADAVASPEMTVIAVDGLPGTGKTKTLVDHVCKTHLADIVLPKNAAEWDRWDKPAQGYHKIVIAKPHVNAGGESYGHLPGDINEKLDPTLVNFIQYFDRGHNAGFSALRDAGYVEILPLGFIRGRDLLNETLVIDEAQNTKDLITAVTRKGEGSRIFAIGDTSPFQIDLKGNSPERNGLAELRDLLMGATYFQYIEMRTVNHIVRSGEVRDVIRRLFKKHGLDTPE